MSISLHWLDEDPAWFPPVSTALNEPQGLLAAGGDLTQTRLLNAYAQGIFPWFSEGEPILWWSPDPRSIVHPDEVHCSRSLAKFMRKNLYRVTFDQAFERVIDGCASPRATESGTWITAEMRHAYINLHKAGFAHSVDVWHGDDLVGGLYGLSMGGAFFGESMFSLATNASKVAFISLSQQLSRWGFVLIDCQVQNPYLASMGAHEVPRRQFLSILDNALAISGPEEWRFDRQ